MIPIACRQAERTEDIKRHRDTYLANRNAQEIVDGLVGEYDSKWDGGYLLDMAEQAVINSRLALMKALRFNTALGTYTIAPALLLILLFAK